MDTHNPYRNTFHLWWVLRHPISLTYWVLVQLRPTPYGELAWRNQYGFNWKNLGSFVQIALLTIINVILLIFLQFGTVLLYLVVDILESNWNRNRRIKVVNTDTPSACTDRIYFINGIATTAHWFDLNCRRLANHFGAPVHGIYNPSYGLVADLFESLVQRNFHIQTDIIQPGCRGNPRRA
jgi:hypothetical protein